MCLAEVLSMTGTFSFPALLPIFFDEWGLTNTQAGWINGAYFAGYTLAVPVLAGLTDRIDGRSVFLCFSAVGAAAALGFALFSEGFGTALVYRTLGGFGLAGTFIPGLKALVDRIEGKTQARAVSFYTAAFSLGLSLSFYINGKLGAIYGWRWAFGAAAAVAIMALPIALFALKPRKPQPTGTAVGHFLDFRPVLKNREAMAYVLGYAAHMWELFAFRSWIVAFLAFSLALHPGTTWRPAPSTVAALAGLIAMWASVGGAELAMKFGRRKVLTLIMSASALLGCSLGFFVGLPYAALAALCVFYALFVQGDSAALHTGVIQAADPQRRGATMAFQSLLGFGSAAVGPLAVGAFLDLTASSRPNISWGVAFISMGAGVALGPILLRLMARPTRRPG